MQSLHSRHLYTGDEDVPDFPAAVALGERRRHGRSLPPGARWPRRTVYQEAVRYTEQVARYFDVFGREHVHVVIFDDFVSDPVPTYEGVLRFLVVDPGHRPAFRVVNPNRTARSPWLRTLVRDPMPSVRRAARRLLRGRVRRRLGEWLIRVNGRPAPRPAMPPETRGAIQAQLAPEVTQLEALLGRDLTHWTR